MMTKEQKQSFMMGSWVGVAQSFVALAVAVRWGTIPAFLSSLAVYVVLYKGYNWALSSKTEEEQPK